MAVCTLFLQRPDRAFDHTVLLRAVWRNELLLQTVAAHQTRVVAAGKDQAVIGAEQERLGDAAQRAITGDQGLLRGCCRRAGLATARELPAQQLPRVAILSLEAGS